MTKKSTPKESISAYLGEERHRAKEFLLGTTIILAGFALLFYIFAGSSDGLVYEDHNFQPVTKVSHYVNESNKTHGKMSPDWIKCYGDFRTFSAIQFKLKSANSRIKYVFDFGDGIQKDCKGEKIQHYYRRAGQYTINVIAHNGVEEVEAWTKTITIKNGIQIDPSAYREY